MQADNAVFTFEVVDNPDGMDFSVQVYHKNSEEYGAGTAKGSPSTASSGFIQMSQTAFREMVRFGITVQAPKASPTGTGVVYRMLAPTWYDEANT